MAFYMRDLVSIDLESEVDLATGPLQIPRDIWEQNKGWMLSRPSSLENNGQAPSTTTTVVFPSSMPQAHQAQ